MKGKLWLFLFILGIFCFNSAQAGIVIIGTRVIYPSDKKSISVQISNEGDFPALVQAWIDNGDPTIAPSDIRTPFIITPPLSRVEPKKGQTLRLTFTGEHLPNNKESLFYFNVLEVPPKPKQSTHEEPKNYLQIAVRNRLKLFYRPVELTLPLEKAYQQVIWKISKQGGRTFLIADNPSPYYITYSSIQVIQNSQRWNVLRTGMVAPLSQQTFELPSTIPSSVHKIQWKVINDYGGSSQGLTSLSNSSRSH